MLKEIERATSPTLDFGLTVDGSCLLSALINCSWLGNLVTLKDVGFNSIIQFKRPELATPGNSGAPMLRAPGLWPVTTRAYGQPKPRPGLASNLSGSALLPCCSGSSGGIP